MLCSFSKIHVKIVSSSFLENFVFDLVTKSSYTNQGSFSRRSTMSSSKLEVFTLPEAQLGGGIYVVTHP